MVACSKAWNIFAQSKTWIVGSNPIRSVDVCPHFFCVYIILFRYGPFDRTHQTLKGFYWLSVKSVVEINPDGQQAIGPNMKGHSLTHSWSRALLEKPAHEWTCPIHISNIPCPKSYVRFISLRPFIQRIRPGQRLFVIFHNKLTFWGELLAPCQTPQLEDHPLSAVREWLFNILAATLHIRKTSPPSATWVCAMSWYRRRKTIKIDKDWTESKGFIVTVWSVSLRFIPWR
jgi:hypothetical protein